MFIVSGPKCCGRRVKISRKTVVSREPVLVGNVVATATLVRVQKPRAEVEEAVRHGVVASRVAAFLLGMHRSD